jgi:formylglycine-generating enzyme required for sulfatase activity
MYKNKIFVALIVSLSNFQLLANTLPDSLFVLIPGGIFEMGEPESSYKGPPGSFNAFPHNVTVSSFQMSKTEVTNDQYVEFLNSAQLSALVEVQVETVVGPDLGSILVFGTTGAPSDYSGKAILNLSGTRVMKDHDNADDDNDPFTGVIEPENPLNITYIGYDERMEMGERFYVKDPRNSSDFMWEELTNYYNYSNVSRQHDKTILLNDFNEWDELADYPNNLPSLDDVKTWPATFIRWYGAKAFVLYYGLDLPTEAQWEYAAQGGVGYVYATSDGAINGDGSSAIWNHKEENPSKSHVLDVRINQPNPYGLYNMAGNVWEWIEDWYDSAYYNNSANATNPVNKTNSGFKVRRGGSWNYHLSTLKSAARAYDEQFKGNDHFGVRIVNNTIQTSAHPHINDNPSSFQLTQNYPNPFNPSTIIEFVISKPGNIRIEVFDILGQSVKTLVNSYKPAGIYQTSWDGFDHSNMPVSGGVYFYSLKTENSLSVNKMILAR